MALIEKLTLQFHQDLIDGDSCDLPLSEVAVAARRKYGFTIQERISDDFKGKYVLAGHVQQLVQKLQRSPFVGIVVPVCCALQSKAVKKESYENDLMPFLNKLQRKDLAIFMKRVNMLRAQHVAAVEQVRKRLQGQKVLLVVSVYSVTTYVCTFLTVFQHYCRERGVKESQ